MVEPPRECYIAHLIFAPQFPPEIAIDQAGAFDLRWDPTSAEKETLRCVVHIAETDERSAQDGVPRPELLSQRRCLYSGSRFCTQERPVRWSRVERKWAGLRPLRRGWGSRRMQALREKCEVETCGANFKQAGIRCHVDRIMPARLIRRLKAGNPDRPENF